MNISLYISELLRDNDEVSLSDVGIFFKKRVPSAFNMTAGTYSVPYEKIHFRESADTADDLLVKYISHVKKISEASSRYFLNKFVSNLKQNLISFNEAEFSPIGILKSDNSGLQLITKEDPSSHYGLTPVKEPSQFSQIKRMESPIPDVEEPFIKEDEGEKINSSWKTTLSVIAVCIIVISMIYIFNPSIFNLTSDTPIPIRNKIINNKPEEKKTVNVAATSDSGVVNNETKPDSLVSKGNQDKEKAIEPGPKYEVIGASFALPTEAQTYVAIIQSRGIKAKILEDSKRPKYKISLGSFSTYEEANLEKRRVQKTFNKEAWILTINAKAKQ